jgi:hypothetical protein
VVSALPQALSVVSQVHLNNRLARVFSRLFSLRRPIPPAVKTDAAVLLRHFGNEAESMARKHATDAGPRQRKRAKHWRLVAEEIARQRNASGRA